MGDFQVERIPKSPQPASRTVTLRRDEYENSEQAYRDSVARLLTANARPFSVSGLMPLDPSTFVLFFRSKTGITHSLDFPIDVEYEHPPALDVLIAACKPYQSKYDKYPDRESLFYPPNLPLTSTLDLANHPIIDAIRNTLFPTLPDGKFLTAIGDKLEVVPSGGRMIPQSRPRPTDGRVATISVTLPVRFRGGTLVVYDGEGKQEKFYGRGGKSGDLEWTAFLADCDYEVETVDKGCRISLTYGVFMKTFGPSGAHPDPLINPSDSLLDLLSPVLNISRGRKIAFNLGLDYGVNPAECLAESLVPQLKGADSLLYHALKLYKLAPELHWAAGGYIWPVHRTMDSVHDVASPDLTSSFSSLTVGHRGAPAVRGAFNNYNNADEAEAEALRLRVENSGAVPITEAEITVLNDLDGLGPIGKERVPFVSGGELEKLVVNVLLVAYVP